MTEARVPWRVILRTTSAAALMPEQRLKLVGLPHEDGPVTVELFTRFDDMELAEMLPRELVLETHVLARSDDHASAIAAATGARLVPTIAFSINAYVDLPLVWLGYEEAQNLTRRRFIQLDVNMSRHLLAPTRLIHQDHLFRLLQATLAPGERSDRIARAISQYHVALRYWTVSGQPLAMAHLYMALEALGPLAEVAARIRLGLSDPKMHARHRNIDVRRSNWKEVLLGWVRRDELCLGDRSVYDAAKDATNSFRHGSGGLAAAYRRAGRDANLKLMGYVRRGILDLLELPKDLIEQIAKRPPLDVTPVRFEVRGELSGGVEDPDDLGEVDQPYPYADWRTTLDALERQEDGTLRLTPRLHLTASLAAGVQLTFTDHLAQTGINDPTMMEFDWPGKRDGPLGNA